MGRATAACPSARRFITYLKLSGKLVGFNVDSHFADVLDGLIVVDLTQTDPRVLDRYMGKEVCAIFLVYRNVKDSRVSA